ncbi:5-formyltetrahydrofolate cyclo-ligase [Clostridium peptidivorans]|uniref:5-formyltetrahydrofolate cyclo-ligase n=1 Tax=Clostridium peptidivorans TaxID=100174 RepID=UPI000BE24BD7|nr:5-formyltetrahydrofolate cyclo-ligase [Clostridium peptidivorans]
MIDKKELRKIILEKRDNIVLDERIKYDNDIFKAVVNSSLYNKSKCIFIFVSYKTEVNTHEIIKYALSQRKRVCVPKVLSKSEGMYAVEIKKIDDLKSGKYGILEPENFENKINEEEIDLALIPGVAFDKNGGRMGYGAAFYDRFLVKLKRDTPKIALAYGMQIVDYIPMNEWDVKVDGIIANG